MGRLFVVAPEPSGSTEPKEQEMSTAPSTLIAVTTTTSLRLRGSLAVQNGVPMLVTFASAAEVIRASKVDTYDPETKAGYQREPQAVRIRKATEYYESGGR